MEVEVPPVVDFVVEVESVDILNSNLVKAERVGFVVLPKFLNRIESKLGMGIS